MINKQIIMGKLIRSLYFKHVTLDENKLKSHDNYKIMLEQCRPIRLTFLDKLKIFCKYNFSFCSKLKCLKFQDDILYDKGTKIV